MSSLILYQYTPITQPYGQLPANVSHELHPTLYDPTGDVVLSASTHRTLPDGTKLEYPQYFRMHRETLVKGSPVFAEMLAPIGHRASSRLSRVALFDGVPHLPLQEDSAEDLASFLHVLCHPEDLVQFIETHGLPGPAQTDAIFRLADKYKNEEVKKPILELLKSWPTTLDAWEQWVAELDAASFQHFSASRRGKSSAPSLNERLPSPDRALRLARLYCPEIIPAVFYSIARTPTNQYVAWTKEPKLHWLDNLELKDQKRLLKGRERLMAESEKLVDVILAPPRVPDDNAAACERPECERFKDWLANTAFTQSSHDVLGVLSRSAVLFQYGRRTDDGECLQFCPACRREVWYRIGKEKRRVWNLLPKIFSLA
ncbi:hypothetical protein OBBRIDRAFT_795231 [Obba rivulosa]|uniref:BTB domain-containing protein n=1 Tax=Obba rivulosa TaxID=1052685 RepID=A0A8E2AQE1_9APHY|nr:hypothetical protein OBBRIDRAFT_795231 [Obba rivulosa]